MARDDSEQPARRPGNPDRAGDPARSGNPARRAEAARHEPRPRTPAAGAPGRSAGPESKVKFPRRDALGRVDRLSELLVGVVVWLLVALALLLVVEGIAAAFGQGFGRTSGWIAGVLAVWLFAEEYRAWRPVPARVAVAALGVVVAGTMGGATSGLLSGLPALVSGFVGVAVAALAYAILWFFGVRVLARRSGEE
jgi:hypothetical protein